MAIFNDLAIEIQEAIWELVLPVSRGVHWIEVEGIPHDPDFVRSSIRWTRWHNFRRIPEDYMKILHSRKGNPEFRKRIEEKEQSTPFFRHLLTTVPAVFGSSGSCNDSSRNPQTFNDLADEIAFTRRCRELSTYYQITTLLSLCRLSRSISERYIRDNHTYAWPIHRSMGSPYRPRPIDVWETQYCSNQDDMPPVSNSRDPRSRQLLRPQIHSLDLVVFRLHDSQGRATPLLRYSPWQYWIEQRPHRTTFGCFDRVGIEWHPLWMTALGQKELRSENVRAMISAMSTAHRPATLYWLVDGVKRPDWDHDYPTVVRDLFEERMADNKQQISKHLWFHWDLSEHEEAAMLADHNLSLEFEANGRRYFIVFVVEQGELLQEQADMLYAAGLEYDAPFPGSAQMWPEAVREPAQVVYNVIRDGSYNMGTHKSISYILSWEPIHR